MQIELDEAAIHAAVEQCTAKAIQGAMSSYEIERVIRDKVVETVIESAIAETVAEAVRAVDLSALHDALAREMSRQVQKLVVTVMQDASVEILLSLQGVPDFDKAARDRARAEIVARLRREG